MTMKTLKMVFGLALALMLALTVTQTWVAAQEGAQDTGGLQPQDDSREHSAQARKIEGVWDVRVTRRDCQTGVPNLTMPPNRVMNMFISGGTLMETGGRPTARGPALGTWQYLGGGSYSAVFRYFRFNPDGTPAGSQKVTRTIELRDDNAFTATAFFEVFDANDNLIQTGCATETATRLE